MALVSPYNPQMAQIHTDKTPLNQVVASQSHITFRVSQAIKPTY